MLLNRRTLHRAERTKDATVTGIGAQQRLAVGALVKELASIGRHRFQLGKSAIRAGQHRFKNYAVHVDLISEPWMENLHSSSP